MANEPMIYRVQLSCEVGDDDDDIEQRLWRGFSEERPLAAMPSGIRLDDGQGTIEFDRLSERAEADEERLTEYAPRSGLIAALTRFDREHTLLVPLLRALLSSAPRASAPAFDRGTESSAPSCPPRRSHRSACRFGSPTRCRRNRHRR